MLDTLGSVDEWGMRGVVEVDPGSGVDSLGIDCRELDRKSGECGTGGKVLLLLPDTSELRPALSRGPKTASVVLTPGLGRLSDRP